MIGLLPINVLVKLDIIKFQFIDRRLLFTGTDVVEISKSIKPEYPLQVFQKALGACLVWVALETQVNSTYWQFSPTVEGFVVPPKS